MRIGILTFHRAYNYGAVLQTYALQEALRNMGHDALVIDFRQPNIENVIPEKSSVLKAAILQPRRAYRRLKWIEFQLKRKEYFEGFIERHLHTTPPCLADSIPQDFDAYVIGSDQLWNAGLTGGKLEPVYLGQFKHVERSRVYGYAISAKLATFDQLGEQALKQVVGRFNALSFREETIAKVAGCLTGRHFPVCCDPTLLIDGSIWDNIANDKYKSRRYVLTYQMNGVAPLLREKAEKLAALMGCEIIDASSYQYSVEDFVSLFKHAQYVITTSFHGTVFAVIFSRPLYSIKVNDGNDGRYVNLLNRIGGESMCVDKDFDPQPIEVDYAPIQQALASLRQQSLDFLQGIR